MCGLDTQESILATKVSNLRNKSHLYSKMTTCVSNCPNFIATGVPIGLYGQTDKQTDKPKATCSPLFQSWGHKNAAYKNLNNCFCYLCFAMFPVGHTAHCFIELNQPKQMYWPILYFIVFRVHTHPIDLHMNKQLKCHSRTSHVFEKV